MLAILSGRPYAYSQGYTEQFLARLAHTKAAECLTETLAKWTWSLWQKERTPPDQTSTPAVFYVDGHRKPVYSAVLVPRGPVGKLDGKILGCRELVLLHDARGHPLLATSYRGDQHLTMGLPHLLHCYEQAIDQRGVQRVVVDREGMAAEFLAQQKLAGRQVVTLLKADQYESEGSFDQVGAWQPWRSNRAGQVICNEEACQVIKSYRLLFQRCRQIGIDAAFAEWKDGQVPEKAFVSILNDLCSQVVATLHNCEAEQREALAIQIEHMMQGDLFVGDVQAFLQLITAWSRGQDAQVLKHQSEALPAILREAYEQMADAVEQETIEQGKEKEANNA